VAEANSGTKRVRQEISDAAQGEARQNEGAHVKRSRATCSAVALACADGYSTRSIQTHPLSVTVSKPPLGFLQKALKAIPRGKGGHCSQHRQMLGNDFWV